MFRFLRKYSFPAMAFFNFSLSSVNSLECISVNNQECKITPEITNINTNEPLIYP